MANYEKVSSDVEDLFEEIRDKSSIPMFVEFQIRSNNKQKDLVKIIKCNDLIEEITDGTNFVLVVNEEILEQLPVDMQKIAFVECLSGVSVAESDAVSLIKPDFSVHSGVLKKYGYESINTFRESTKSLFDAKKQKEMEEKALSKGKRGRKKKDA